MQAHDSSAHAPRANIRGALRDLDKYPEEHQDLGSRINGISSAMNSSNNPRSVRSSSTAPHRTVKTRASHLYDPCRLKGYRCSLVGSRTRSRRDFTENLANVHLFRIWGVFSILGDDKGAVRVLPVSPDHALAHAATES